MNFYDRKITKSNIFLEDCPKAMNNQMWRNFFEAFINFEFDNAFE